MTPAESSTVLDGLPLRYVSHDIPGITRRRSGTGFSYRDPEGKLLKDKAVLQWIRSLAIPPAWTEVWIAPFQDAHLLAVGRDQRGRMQYRYHPEWRAARDATKFERMLAFGRSLPTIRAAVEADLRKPGLHKRRVLAVVVRLLEVTHVRVGNEEYARTNKSYGLTTLKDRHLAINGATLRFRFKGKSGKEHQITLKNRRLARLVGRLQDLPGQQLFQYLDEEGARQAIDSAEVNEYLREIAGDHFTAKDFRTWSATVLCACALAKLEEFDTQAAAKRNLKQAIEEVARRLGHTPTICRKSYVHPQIIDDYLAGELFQVLKIETEMAASEPGTELEPYEIAVLQYLGERLQHALDNVRQADEGTLSLS
ncbi:DNA topoisomerase IB [Geminicoccus roseus]|uniref:DNA topoisomerase IB n=1 Tax=Geminicoccus roseus TaxID=404900 RepID=UPI00040C6925|nr:DNA topoisomerase IB [Geminicoccus roseus]